jgi:hypothetical protein
MRILFLLLFKIYPNSKAGKLPIVNDLLSKYSMNSIKYIFFQFFRKFFVNILIILINN